MTKTAVEAEEREKPKLSSIFINSPISMAKLGSRVKKSNTGGSLVEAKANHGANRAQANADDVASRAHRTEMDHHPAPPLFIRPARTSFSLPGAFSVPGIGGASSRELTRSPQPDPALPNNQNNFTSPLDATLVDQEAQHQETGQVQVQLPEALNVMPMRSKEKESSSSCSSTLVNGCFFVIIAVIVGLVLWLAISQLSNQDLGSSDQVVAIGTFSELAETNRSHQYPPFDSTLHQNTRKAILDDPTGPQASANNWMWEDPYLDSYPRWQKIQRFSLAVVYHAMEGDNWFRNDNWLSYEVPECEWFSQSPTPCDQDGHLVMQDLQSNNLVGTLPMESQLPESMKVLDCSNNHISGGVPFVPSTNKMEAVLLSNNSFDFAMYFVDADLDTSFLRFLKVDSNQLKSNNLRFIGEFRSVEQLNITGNQFGGTIPLWEASRAANLNYLGLGDNLFEGTIPSELGLMTQLTELNLSGNSAVSGTLPSELLLLTSLMYLGISRTSITGSIPIELCSGSLNISITANCSQIQCC
ncbi:Leucine Rich Repeat [Seminavis robusta]|uniref:Leucine Rich Repeat n=1 Tax=Seminavis robusta TaxID=568900 RepID=A0A9N8EIP6_9STRA|nr:Leucine Rich Repeat [Seminavis robusta]|eukprot:Sro1018_g231870.1 Leucine Rich Repeat (527) ;mRNA; f:26742-28322